MPKAAGAAPGGWEVGDFFPVGAFMPCDDHLCYPVAPFDDKFVFAGIIHNDLDLTSIVGIDGPRRIDEHYTMLECEAAAGPDLRFVADR